jgi:hypothetical protein
MYLLLLLLSLYIYIYTNGSYHSLREEIRQHVYNALARRIVNVGQLRPLQVKYNAELLILLAKLRRQLQQGLRTEQHVYAEDRDCIGALLLKCVKFCVSLKALHDTLRRAACVC